MNQDKLLRVKPQRLAKADPDLPSDPIERLVYYARMAPSTHNSQPWKFIVRGETVDLFADFSRALPAVDPERRELHISLGCALETMLIAGDHGGYGVEVDYLPAADESHVCQARFKPGARKRENAAAALLEAVANRHTSHRRFDAGRPLDASDQHVLGAAADGEDVALEFLHGDRRKALIALLPGIEKKLFADAGYRADLARWVGSGAPGSAWLRSKLEQFMLARAGADKLMNTDAELLDSAPVIAVLSTLHDGRLDELRAGHAYARAALIAENHAIRVQPFSAFTASHDGREAVKRIAGLGNRHPQIVFRLGYGEAETSSRPRRSLADVLTKAE